MVGMDASSRNISWATRLAVGATGVTVCLAALGAAPARSAQASKPAPAPAHAVLSWNAFAVNLIVGAEKKQPPEAFVYATYTQAAVYDAVVAIRGGMPAYLPGLRHRPHASVDAAVAAAAYGVLSHFFPDQQSVLNAEYATSLADVPVGEAKDSGVALGAGAADVVLAARSDDGFTRTVTYPPAIGVGLWQPTPPAFLPAQAPQLATMRPFLLASAAQFRPPPPPALNSDVWAQDYNEVKNLGSVTSLTRTAEQTATARFWTGHGLTMYNQLFRQLATSHQLDAAKTARLLVAEDMVSADAFIACFDAKYHYGLWRPVTAIRAGDTDGRQDTAADPTWTPVITTPNHPEYPSNHGCGSAATAAVTASFLGTEDVSVDLFSPATTTTRHFDTVADWLTSVANGRIWGGIHYRFSTDAGVHLGQDVAQYDLTNSFLATDSDAHVSSSSAQAAQDEGEE
jgi:hypothetical protein